MELYEMFFNHYKIYREMFSYIFFREDVEKLKPDPIVHLFAAEKLEIDNSIYSGYLMSKMAGNKPKNPKKI